MYVQLAFVLDRVKALARSTPSGRRSSRSKRVLESDLKAVAGGRRARSAGDHGATHAGTTTEEFEKIVRDWIATAKHPKLGRPYTELVYQPMLELLAFLRANGFKTFIVSGGGVEFMRPWTERVYGVPPEQVIGSSAKVEYEVRDGKPVLVRLPEVDFIDDKAGKPVGIHQFIGRRPIAAFGNSDGDFEMLRVDEVRRRARASGSSSTTTTPSGSTPTTATRTSARSPAASTRPAKRGWTVVDMNQDWKVIYPLQQ